MSDSVGEERRSPKESEVTGAEVEAETNSATSGSFGQPSSSAFSSTASVLPADRDKVEARFARTLGEVLHIALPNVAGYVLMLVNEFVNVLFLGHSGDQAALAGVGLGNMMQNCVALSVGFGIASVLDTLLVWMIPILWFSGDILEAVHERADVARQAEAYNRASVFGLFAALQYEATRRFLFNRKDTAPPLKISLATSVLHIVWCYIFISQAGLSTAGAGFANVITWWLKCLLGWLYLACSAKRTGLTVRAMVGVERQGLHGWPGFLRLAVPATVQVASEWWFWEITALVVGYLGKTSLAAHVTTCNWKTISIMPAIGISGATAALVGNAVGANAPQKIRSLLHACGLVTLVTSTVIASFMVLGRKPLSEAYSDDEEIQEIMQRLLYIAAVNNVLDASKTVMGGALRGIGRQRLCATAYLFTYYGVALPGGILAAFPLHFGVEGVWFFFGVGTGLSLVVFAMALARTNWRRLAAETSARMRSDGHSAEECQPGAPSADLSPTDRDQEAQTVDHPAPQQAPSQEAQTADHPAPQQASSQA